MNKLLVISLVVLSLILAGCSKGTPTGNVIEVVGDEACHDSDNGIDKDTKGVVSVGDETYADSCVSGLLVEYYCDGDNKANQNIRCANKCSNGKCA
jgi:hypothetical protein